MGCFDNFYAHGQQGHNNCRGSRDDKNPNRDACPVGIIVQQLIHEIIGYRPCDHIGHKKQHEKVFGDKGNDIRYRSAQDFTNPNLLGPLICGERSHSEKPKTRDKYGQDRKVLIDIASALVIPILLVKFIIQECIFKQTVGRKFIRLFFQEGNGTGYVVGPYLDKNITVRAMSLRQRKNNRPDLAVKRTGVKIPDDADYFTFILPA